MHPVLIQIGTISLYTYGLFVGLGFLIAVWFSGRRAAAVGIQPERITDLFFVIVVSAIIGARLFYVLLNLSQFTADPLAVFKLWNGGLVFYGGFIAAVVAAIIAAKKMGLELWPTADLIAPAIALGHSVGRIGCFFAGCCYGKVCDLPWAISFSNPDSLAPLGILLHPTQLYSVLSNFALLIFLLWLEKRKTFHGMVFWVYILFYGLLRSFVELYRGDIRGHFIVDALSFSQGIGLSMSLFAMMMLFYLSGKQNNAGD